MKKGLNISVKRINQKIKRKTDQIKKIQPKFDMTTLAMNLSETKKQFSSLERKKKHTKLHYRVLFPSETPGEIKSLHKQLAEKNTVILELQDEKLVLEEHLKDSAYELTSTKRWKSIFFRYQDDGF